MVLNMKEYNKDDLIVWAKYDDGSVADILVDYRKTLYGALDYIKGKRNTDLFDTTDSLIAYRQDIFVGLIVRSLYDASVTKEEFDIDKVERVVNIFIKEYPDILTAPASTRFHGDWVGGLMDHSFVLYEKALQIKNGYWDVERVPSKLYPIFFILHDLCKCGYYTTEKKNAKNVDTGKWEVKEAYTKCKNVRSAQHGPESINRIYELILKYRDDMDWLEYSFTENWKLSITYHMGMYDMSDSGMGDYGEAIRSYPEVLLMHTADIIASQLFGV